MPTHSKNERETEHTLPLTDRQKELMLTVLLRDQDCFDAARMQLRPEHFAEDDRRLALIWNTACEFHDTYQMLPDKEQLTAEVEQRLGLVDDVFDDRELTAIDEFIEDCYGIPQETISPKYGLAMTKRFIVDAMAADFAQETAEWGGTRPLDFGKLLSRQQELLMQVETLESKTEQAFPENWTPKALHKTTTGLPFWDHFMNGGQAGGEVYGLLGPFGSCKTTLITQTAVAQCRYLNGLWLENGRQGMPKQIYLATYEESCEEIRMRVLGCAAQILRNRLEELENWEALESNEMLGYERTFFANALQQGLAIPTEYRRAQLAMRWINRSLVILDMSGDGKGTGLADELAATIRADQKKKGNPGVHSVFVDYAGAAVERFLDSRDLDRKEMRARLKTFPMHCKQKIAVPHNASVWIAHQLSGAANAKGTSQAQHHTDAAETKSFAENLVFCFTVGTKDQTTSNCVLAKTKARRAGGSPHRVIRVAGELWRVEDVDHLYAIDPATNRIVSRSELNRVHDAREPATALPGSRNHNMSQFSQASIAGIPGDEDEAPRYLARRKG